VRPNELLGRSRARTAFCLARRTRPHAVRESRQMLAEFQARLHAQGVETRWPAIELRRTG